MVRQVDLREITRAAVVSLRTIQVDVDRQVVIGQVTLLDVVDQLAIVRDAKTIR